MQPGTFVSVLPSCSIDRDSGPKPLIYFYTHLLSFVEADSYCFCMYLSPLLFILSIHLEQAMAETTIEGHGH